MIAHYFCLLFTYPLCLSFFAQLKKFADFVAMNSIIYFSKNANTGWGKSRFTVVSTQNTEFIFVSILLFIVIIFSIRTTVNLHFPTLYMFEN